jgi:hypothetical protein
LLPRQIAPVGLEQDVPAQHDLRALIQQNAAFPTPIGAAEHDSVEQTV